MNKYWAQGFEKRCQERGVDPNALIKWASDEDEKKKKKKSGLRRGAEIAGGVAGVGLAGLGIAHLIRKLHEGQHISRSAEAIRGVMEQIRRL